MAGQTVPDRRAAAVRADRDHGPSLADIAVAAITAAILSGRNVPGQKLVEADLATTLGISRGPLREALQRLEAQGIVMQSRHRGAYIRAFSRREMTDLLVVLEALTRVMARLAALAVAGGAETDTLRDMQAKLATWGAPAAAGRALAAERQHFYDVLIALGGNRELNTMLPVMRIHLLRLQVQPWFSATDIADRSAEYAAVIDAVLAGDARAAEAAMLRHMRRMTVRLARLPDAAFTSH